MPPKTPASLGWPDWRDADDYAWLLHAGRPVFAWEWLRRSPAYRAAWHAGGDARVFGLVRLEDPARDARTARPIWHADADPSVLLCWALTPGRDISLLELSDFVQVAAGEPGSGIAEHLLLSDGLRSIRIDVIEGTVCEGPVAVRWSIDGVTGLGPQLLALRRFTALVGSGDFAGALHRGVARAARYVLMLRTSDGLAAGASQRDFAEVLLGAPVTGQRWRIEAPSWRLRAQRLVGAARDAMVSGPSVWLRR